MKTALVIFSMLLSGQIARALPAGFVNLAKQNSEIFIEARYFSSWNFLGRKVAGYRANKCILTTEAAEALVKAQKTVELLGYSLLVFDCYRPQRAVDDFFSWSLDLKDQKMKDIYYPNQPKESAFEDGYIAKKSGHSRGSTVDLTLVDRSLIKQKNRGQLQFQEEALDCRAQKNIEKTAQLDMGTIYDCMDELSATLHPGISSKAKRNREILVNAMAAAGFVNYSKEWWHYTLKNEPFKDSYFDFLVQ
jgi:D-alanyl-D-alanine dipeptidase